MNTFIRLLICGMLLITGVTLSHAAEQNDSFPVEQKVYQGIPYVSGGVGLEEREQFAAIGKNYNLKLVFAFKSGAYLSDVKVDISDSIGKKVLSAIAEGPWFFTALPPGKYTITATMMGKEKLNKVNIGKDKKQTVLRFSWNE